MARPITYCSVDGCDRRCHGGGLCNTHYRRVKKHGAVDVVKRVYRGPSNCTIPGCPATGPTTRGMCTLHYQRWAKHGDPQAVMTRAYTAGEEHHAWVGNAAAYRTVHNRLAVLHGTAREHMCALCPSRADQWSYDHTDPDETTEVIRGFVVPFSYDLDRYQPLCFSCHTRRDTSHARLREVS